MRKWLAAIVIAVFVLGQGADVGHAQFGKDFYQKIHQINHSVDKKNWKRAKQGALSLEKTYNKKRWKLMFLGDESEYEGLDVDMQRLKSAISSKSKSDAKIELAEIQSILKNIYSF